MTTVVKTHDAQDFLALVPQLAGYHPRDSVLLVAFRGNRTCAALRFNLPTAKNERIFRRVATSVVGTLCKVRGADAVVPVIYTDETFAGAGGIPAADFMTAVTSRAELSGFLVRDALCVAADGWGSYLEVRPTIGRPLAEIAASAVHESVPEELRKRLGDVTDGFPLPPVELSVRERVARLLERYRGGVFAPSGQEEFGIERRLLEHPALFAECALGLDPDRMDDSIAALLILCLSSPPVRDSTMLQWAFDLEVGDRVLEENARFLAGDLHLAEGAAGRIWGDGPRPDAERIYVAMALLRSLAARAPRSARPPLLCMLGWLSWALGRSSLAGRFVDQALDIDRTYGLAEVLHSMLAAGHLPEWAFDEPEPGESRSGPDSKRGQGSDPGLGSKRNAG
ncbi:MAG: hypothetical protein JWL94_206 [Microbacteriaceae bacterium]|jgi:hypothetical protein|nr:hypothetical protein [Microbacteriaceae bacterium]